MSDVQPLTGASSRAYGRPSGRQPADSRPLVLVVDDHEDTRFMIKWLLERRGWRVAGTADGLEAVEAARRSHPDVILMDVGLPVLDGLSATRRIREDAELQGVPVVAVSGYAAAEDQASALAAGCDEYIVKPINFDELYRTLSRLLPERQSRARTHADV